MLRNFVNICMYQEQICATCYEWSGIFCVVFPDLISLYSSLASDLHCLFLRVYVDPMVGTDGASANNNGDIAGKATSRTADGLELWISVCNTLGTACNNPQNGMCVVCVCLHAHMSCV